MCRAPLELSPLGTYTIHWSGAGSRQRRHATSCEFFGASIATASIATARKVRHWDSKLGGPTGGSRSTGEIARQFVCVAAVLSFSTSTRELRRPLADLSRCVIGEYNSRTKRRSFGGFRRVGPGAYGR